MSGSLFVKKFIFNLRARFQFLLPTENAYYTEIVVVIVFKLLI